MKQVLIVLIFILTAACEQTEEVAMALGTLERDRIELTAESFEPVTEILVLEGDEVSKGDVILTQDSSRIEVQIMTVEAEKQLAESRLEELINGPRPQEIERVKAQIAAAQSRINTVGLELKRERELVEKKFVSENRIDILQGQQDEAIANRKEAEALLDELLEGTRAEQIDQARHNISIIDARIESLQIDLERLTITSPVIGVVDSIPVELGERPTTNVTVAVVLKESPVYARVYVPETIRTQLKTGTRAEIHIDSITESVSAHVRWVAIDSVFTPYFALNQSDRSRLSYIAEVVVDDDNASSLPVGVPVEVTFPGIVYD